MAAILFLGRLEGGSALLADDRYCGEVRHSIRIYRDTLRDVTVAAGEVWGEGSVLQHAAEGQNAMLRLQHGENVRVVVRRRAIDRGYVSVGVEGAVPGF